MNEMNLRDSFNYCMAMDGVKTPDDAVTTLSIIGVTQTIIADDKTSVDKNDEFYVTAKIKEVAYGMGIDIPMKNERELYHAYLYTPNPLDFKELVAFLGRSYKFGMCSISNVILPKLLETLGNNAENVLIAGAMKCINILQPLINSIEDARYVLTCDSVVEAVVLARVLPGAKIIHPYFLANYDETKWANVDYLPFVNVEIRIGTIATENLYDGSYDRIIAFPSMGIINANRFEHTRLSEYISRDCEGVTLERLLPHMGTKCSMCLIMPARITFAGGRVAKLRTKLENEYHINEVSELPSGIYEKTGVKTAFLKLSNYTIDEDLVWINKYEISSETGELVLLEGHQVRVDAVKENGDWTTNKFSSSFGKDLVNYYSSYVPKMKLSEVADISRGKTINKRSEINAEGSKYAIVNISNIGEYEMQIDNSTMDMVPEDKRIKDYVLQEGDLLIPARGTTIRVGLFHEQKFPCIASANLIVIRPHKDKMNSIYLKLFFDTNVGRMLIQGTQMGGTVINIRYSDLGVIDVPVPELSIQNKIGDGYLGDLDSCLAAIEKAKEDLQDLKKIYSRDVLAGEWGDDDVDDNQKS